MEARRICGQAIASSFQAQQFQQLCETGATSCPCFNSENLEAEFTIVISMLHVLAEKLGKTSHSSLLPLLGFAAELANALQLSIHICTSEPSSCALAAVAEYIQLQEDRPRQMGVSERVLPERAEGATARHFSSEKHSRCTPEPDSRAAHTCASN